MPTRSVAPNSSIIATLEYDGTTADGTVQGEERRITGYSVTNNAGVPVLVQVEMESDKLKDFSGVVQVGESVNGNVSKPVLQYWNTEGPLGGRWDGINIRWRIPA